MSFLNVIENDINYIIAGDRTGFCKHSRISLESFKDLEPKSKTNSKKIKLTEQEQKLQQNRREEKARLENVINYLTRTMKSDMTCCIYLKYDFNKLVEYIEKTESKKHIIWFTEQPGLNYSYVAAIIKNIDARQKPLGDKIWENILDKFARENINVPSLVDAILINHNASEETKKFIKLHKQNQKRKMTIKIKARAKMQSTKEQEQEKQNMLRMLFLEENRVIWGWMNARLQEDEKQLIAEYKKLLEIFIIRKDNEPRTKKEGQLVKNYEELWKELVALGKIKYVKRKKEKMA